MDRRLFLRNASLLAAGVVAADQLDLLERLTHRKNWPGGVPKYVARPVRVGSMPGLVWRHLNAGVLPVKPTYGIEWVRVA